MITELAMQSHQHWIKMLFSTDITFLLLLGWVAQKEYVELVIINQMLYYVVLPANKVVR